MIFQTLCYSTTKKILRISQLKSPYIYNYYATNHIDISPLGLTRPISW